MINTEVIILGKGIAGLTLAYLLKQQQIDYVIVDRFEDRKQFAYGETLPPSAMPLLYKLGLLALFEENSYRKTYGYHSCWGSDRVTDINFYHHNPYKHGLKIDKQKILHALEETTQAEVISYKKSFEVLWDDTSISGLVLDTNIQINGNYFVDATGRNRALLKKLQISSVAYDNLLSFSCHLSKVKHPKLVHGVCVESFEYGWGIVSALNEDQNVASIFTTKESAIHKELTQYSLWKKTLASTKYLKDFLTDEVDSKVMGGNSNSSKPQKIAEHNWLALGDAAIAFDPLSSHGITNALYTAMIAADTIKSSIEKKQSDAIENYNDTLHKIFDQYLQSKNRLYVGETRWKEAPFWKPFFEEKTVNFSIQ
jgi:flavin-dependent dehydrogenase